jgi:hypothetical protein
MRPCRVYLAPHGCHAWPVPAGVKGGSRVAGASAIGDSPLSTPRTLLNHCMRGASRYRARAWLSRVGSGWAVGSGVCRRGNRRAGRAEGCNYNSDGASRTQSTGEDVGGAAIVAAVSVQHIRCQAGRPSCPPARLSLAQHQLTRRPGRACETWRSPTVAVLRLRCDLLLLLLRPVRSSLALLYPLL